MMEPRWVEYLLLALGFIDLLDAASVLTATAIVLLLRQHQWRRAFSSFYISTGLGVLSRVGLIQHLPSFRLFLLLMASLLVLIHPIARLPALTGHHRISCISSRLSGLDVRIFYPCTKPEKNEQSVRYLEWGSHTPVGMARYGKVPAFLFSHMPSFRLRAYKEAPFFSDMKERCPLILFSHGLGGTFEVYSALLEEWASRGFIVAAVNHSDGSAAAYRLPDQPSLQLYTHPENDASLMDYRTRQLDQRVAELRAVLSAILQDGNIAHDISSRVDRNRIFVVGHSFGAATALSASHVDDRIRAAVALDLWAQPVRKEVFSKDSRLQSIPVLHVVSSMWANSVYFRDFISSGKHNSKFNAWVVNGARHASFSDLYMYSPLIYKLFYKPTVPAEHILIGTSRLTAEFLQGDFSEKNFVQDFPFFEKAGS